MSRTVEVFADICCPFTHVGLRLLTAHLGDGRSDVDLVVRAWPLEWVNGVPLEAEATAAKIVALRQHVAPDLFTGFRVDRWPDTSIPALNLSAAGYDRDGGTGLQVSLALRDALFEQGEDVGDASVLADIARRFDLPVPTAQPTPQVIADYEAGQERDVTGSPHFWIDGEDFFCPSLDIGRDEAGQLTAEFDQAGLARILSALPPHTTS